MIAHQTFSNLRYWRRYFPTLRHLWGHCTWLWIPQGILSLGICEDRVKRHFFSILEQRPTWAWSIPAKYHQIYLVGITIEKSKPWNLLFRHSHAKQMKLVIMRLGKNLAYVWTYFLFADFDSCFRRSFSLFLSFSFLQSFFSSFFFGFLPPLDLTGTDCFERSVKLSGNNFYWPIKTYLDPFDKQAPNEIGRMTNVRAWRPNMFLARAVIGCHVYAQPSVTNKPSWSLFITIMHY